MNCKSYSKKKPAVVLLSGGIDSTVTLAVARNEGFGIYAISFDYGQRHHIELSLAKQCAAYFNVKKHLIVKFNLREIGGSALTSDIEVPKKSQKSEVRSQKLNPLLPPFTKGGPGGINHSLLIPVTYVPARNTIFLSFALAFAENIGAEDIFIGANAVDYSGYPDCRPEFIDAFENMANLATKASVEGTTKFKIRTPLINLTKGEIIKKGVELDVDFSLTWSCYDPKEVKRHGDTGTRGHGDSPIHPFTDSLLHRFVPCMQCDSCLLRAKGFREAGVSDSLSFKVKY